ncbi:hypothetical protein M406DRAFT_264712 [Cryphonectria parasitica EP155]|uniref:protein-histidine N-methyltransferase n=1 Tax=Cryphonectria parasitica (strain ATCC 38755 / EP155) TaxID=660469 RepID=A0A9P5CLY7_CRYP1|nr:uncharacterized protein M406DRAFT_264712 [Cryphonectria parasitica EP155]KAF3762531.1 hypothetical protein M406DRAFT_264712 [Cryphonectria parasitica EP155]
MSFSFSFSGDDIEAEPAPPQDSLPLGAAHAPSAASAFPVQGKPQLPPTTHDLSQMLAALPSKIAYSLLEVDLDGRAMVQIPRRELWDVRVQLMAEDDGENCSEEVEPGLGNHDVKTGIYEGGFKSWESSVDLVKVLAAEGFSRSLTEGPSRVIELGCGTALPSLALFQWAIAERVQVREASKELDPLCLTLADYNPSVLRLVTMPNFLLAWALHQQSHDEVLQAALTSIEGELEINEHVVGSFTRFLASSGITLSFVSGGWSSEFVDLLYGGSSAVPSGHATGQTLVLGAETIYSPFALNSFTETLLSILQREHDSHPDRQANAIVAAKRLYFGVGGSLDDFVDKIQKLGVAVGMVREETEGVRRGVVRCSLP